MSQLLFGPGQKLLFIGDSITDAGRRTEPHVPYGRGYVGFIRALLLARYPALGLEIVNRGIGGNTVRDLAQRWEQDAIAEQPDWLSVQVGINDCYRALVDAERGVPPEEYEATYRALLARTREGTRARVVLMEPFLVAPPVAGDPDALSGMTFAQVRSTYPRLRQNGVTEGPEVEGAMIHWRALLDRYIAAVHRLAQEFDAVLVRTQAAWDAAIVHRPPQAWAGDRVHPDAPGHALIARAFLRTVGYGDV